MMQRKFQPLVQWKELLKDKDYRISLLIGILVMELGFLANRLATDYVESIEVYAVKDLILGWIPTLDLNFFYVSGIVTIISGIVFYALIFRPEIAPFGLKTYGSFIIIRSFFISLTHIGVPADYLKYAGPSESTPILVSFFYQNDLFFSAHTGIPFLAFLLFYKENRKVAYFFLAGSFVMALTVLFMHVHYSIDVFAAYFITYSIYKVSDGVFNKLNYKFKAIVRLLYERSLKHQRKLHRKLNRFRFW